MFYFNYYSPLGKMIAIADERNLLGLYFLDQKYFDLSKIYDCVENDKLKVFVQCKKFLDDYFSGKIVDNSNIPICLHCTDFCKMVLDIVKNIGYGKTLTYKEIAEKIFLLTGKKTSARAVGNAVGHNPISIIIPCHRVIGSNGAITGYAGGLDKKKILLQIEAKNKL